MNNCNTTSIHGIRRYVNLMSLITYCFPTNLLNFILKEFNRTCLACCIIIISANIVFCFWIENSKKETFKNKLLAYNEVLTYFLINDIKTAISPSPLNFGKSFHLFKKIESITQDTHDTSLHIVARPYELEISNKDQKYRIDLQQLREIIDDLVPSFLSYQIKIDGHHIASRYGKEEDSLVYTSKTDPEINLEVKVAIDLASLYYQQVGESAQTNKILVTTVTLIFNLLILCAYLNSKKKVDEKIKILEMELSEQKKTM